MSLQFYSFHGKPISVPTGMVMVGDMMPDCGDSFPSFQEDISEIHLLGNGKLVERETQVIHEFNHYCIEDQYLDGGKFNLGLCMYLAEGRVVVWYNAWLVAYCLTAAS